MQDRFDAIRSKTAEVLALAQTLYGVKIEPQILFNLTGRNAAQACCRMCRITRKAIDFKLRFNREVIPGKHFEDILANTVPHEVAHLCCYARPDLGRQHDAGWRRVCIALGGNGNTYHNYETTPKGGGFTYQASCGTKVTVSKQIHNKIQAGDSRVIKKTRGRVDRFCLWAPQGQPLPTVPPMRKIAEITWPKTAALPALVPTTPAAQPPIPAQRIVKTTKTGEITWAEKVRQLIRVYKPKGTSQETVISLAIMNLGMTKERARSCVKAHWNKV